jgi:hypothetical protein
VAQWKVCLAQNLWEQRELCDGREGGGSAEHLSPDSPHSLPS